MNISFASVQGSGKASEDWAGATSSCAVVLDGITSPPGLEDTGCIHGTPWLVPTIGSELLSLAEQRPELELPEMVGRAIASTAARHADSCDLDAPATPSAAVAMVRAADTLVDFLVLSDVYVVLDTGDDLHVITDVRGHEVVAELRAATFAHPIGTEEHAASRRRMVRQQRLYRNDPDGYWVAAGKPAAAHHAVVGQLERADVRRTAVLSDGAAALVEYGLVDWSKLLDILEREGPASLIQRVRDAEASDIDGVRWPRFKRNDDATAIFCTP
jgi:hypothetical protein